MRYRTLGKTGLRVSEIGYGAWGIGKALWVGAEDEESLRSLRAARDAGVTSTIPRWFTAMVTARA